MNSEEYTKIPLNRLFIFQKKLHLNIINVKFESYLIRNTITIKKGKETDKRKRIPETDYNADLRKDSHRKDDHSRG